MENHGKKRKPYEKPQIASVTLKTQEFTYGQCLGPGGPSGTCGASFPGDCKSPNLS